MLMAWTVERPAYHFYQWAWASLDWLFPPRCGGCESVGARWCAACQAGVQELGGGVCERCGQPAVGGMCSRCAETPASLTALRSWAVYAGPLRQAVHRLKYRGDMSLGEILSRPMIRLLKQLGWPVDLVLPVPTGVVRQAERGYNQAAMLARPLALACGLAYQPHALARVRETRTQVGLTVPQRIANVAGAFEANPKRVAAKNVLVVDDVTTSGATLDACAAALVNAGALRVYGLTLARTILQP